MPPIPKIDRLPAAARQALQEWLSNPAISQQEATAALHDYLDSIDWTGARPSYQAVNRYALKFGKLMQRRREANEVAEQWVSQFGRVPQGQLGQLIIQMVQGMAFDRMVQLDGQAVDPEDLPGQVRMLRDLGAMIERTERAATLNAERERAIARAAMEDLAQTAATKGDPRTAESIRALVAEVYGV